MIPLVWLLLVSSVAASAAAAWQGCTDVRLDNTSFCFDVVGYAVPINVDSALQDRLAREGTAAAEDASHGPGACPFYASQEYQCYAHFPVCGAGGTSQLCARTCMHGARDPICRGYAEGYFAQYCTAQLADGLLSESERCADHDGFGLHGFKDDREVVVDADQLGYTLQHGERTHSFPGGDNGAIAAGGGLLLVGIMVAVAGIVQAEGGGGAQGGSGPGYERVPILAVARQPAQYPPRTAAAVAPAVFNPAHGQEGGYQMHEITAR